MYKQFGLELAALGTSRPKSDFYSPFKFSQLSVESVIVFTVSQFAVKLKGFVIFKFKFLTLQASQ